SHLPVVDRVSLDWVAYWGCLTHAMVTENEEIMGLCLGEELQSAAGDAVGGVNLEILAFLPLLRVDKRKDRVEIEPDQLVAATQRADELTAQLGRTVRVVGWYHSHPHITALPSHVDLATQLSYQQLAESFVGLIFAVYSGHERGQRCQALCFQNVRGSCAYIPMRVRPPHCATSPDAAAATAVSAAENAAGVVALPRLLFEEEQREFEQQQQPKSNQKATASSSNSSDSVVELAPACAYACNVGSIVDRLIWPLIQVARDRCVDQA
ncbi:hypothetical protein BOX15_Mlig014230g2, partial [Macrostomum lignano]